MIEKEVDRSVFDFSGSDELSIRTPCRILQAFAVSKSSVISRFRLIQIQITVEFAVCVQACTAVRDPGSVGGVAEGRLQAPQGSGFQMTFMRMSGMGQTGLRQPGTRRSDT